MTDEIRPAEPPTQLPPEPAPKRSLTWLWVLIAVTITAGITYAVAIPGSEPAAEASPSPSASVSTSPSQTPEEYAIEKCREEVTSRLKAPATASFPGGEEVAVTDDYVYTVGGKVDSENSFSATIRTGWVCIYKAAAGTVDVYLMD